eukprot:XP_001199619.1 PREDICTED: histamine H2 receptor-like [Strongylocentrotus purpuratus]
MAIYYTLLNTTTFQLNTFTGRTAVYLGIGIPCIIVLLAGNVMVIAAVFTQRALKKPSYYLLTSLAITDVITGTIAIPLELYRRVVTNDITCSAKWDVYFTSVVYMCASDSMFHMVIITFDRYLAVLKPLRYNALMTPQRILMLALLGWLTSTLIAIEQIVTESVKPTIPSFYCSNVRIYPTTTTDTNDILIFCIIISCNVAVVMFNIQILRIAVKQARRITAIQCVGQGTATSSENRDAAFRQIRASRLIVCVVIAFLICHTPHGVRRLCLVVSNDFAFNGAISHVDILLYFISSAINPFIYCRMDRVFRESVVRMVRSVWRSRATGNEEHMTTTTDQSMTYTA